MAKIQPNASIDPDSEGKAALISNERLYDAWAPTYDTVLNKTRDLEKNACRFTLAEVLFETVIELGCGTGKNTAWLAWKARHLIAVDISAEMQAIAKGKVSGKVDFKIADITKPWDFASGKADLITCSLILEHVKNLDFVFGEAARSLKAGSIFISASCILSSNTAAARPDSKEAAA